MNGSSKQILFTTLLTVLLFAAFAESPEQQATKKKTATSGELFEVISRMDAAMFAAFNAHDVEGLMALFTDDLEFYHDTGGLTDYRQTAESFKKVFTANPDIRRDLLPGTLEVYPIKDQGAIEIGEHRFCHTERSQNVCGAFKFVMVWRKTGESWKISRVISYGH